MFLVEIEQDKYGDVSHKVVHFQDCHIRRTVSRLSMCRMRKHGQHKEVPQRRHLSMLKLMWITVAAACSICSTCKARLLPVGALKMTWQSSLLNSGLCICGRSQYQKMISRHCVLASCNIAASEVFFIPQGRRQLAPAMQGKGVRTSGCSRELQSPGSAHPLALETIISITHSLQWT